MKTICEQRVESNVQSPPYHPPGRLSEPDVSNDRVALIERAVGELAKKDEHTRNRVNLSLDWFLEAISSAGFDGLLRCWFALETLAMPNDSNIKPVKDALGRVYGTGPESDAAKDVVGRFCRLRGKVVHDGARPAVSSQLGECLRAIYVDVLFELLGLPPERWTSEALAKQDVKSELTSLLAST